MNSPAVTCNSCGHVADPAGMIPELTTSWEPTGNAVCRDADGCFTRRLARDRERLPADVLRKASEADSRYCPTCHSTGNDDSRMGIDRVWNVEGAGPDGVLADVCEQGHAFPIENEED